MYIWVYANGEASIFTMRIWRQTLNFNSDVILKSYKRFFMYEVTHENILQSNTGRVNEAHTNYVKSFIYFT